jgi:hypothetical protein
MNEVAEGIAYFLGVSTLIFVAVITMIKGCGYKVKGKPDDSWL